MRVQGRARITIAARQSPPTGAPTPHKAKRQFCAFYCRRHPPTGAHAHNKQAERLAPLPSGNPRHEAHPNPQQSKTQVLRLSGSRDDVPCGCRAEPANPCRRQSPPPGAHPHNKQAERLAPLPAGNPRHEAQSEPIKTNTSAAEAGFSENRPAPNKRRAERRAGPQNCREHAAKNRAGAGAAGPTPPQKRRGKVYFPQKRRNFGKIMQKFPRRGIYNERTNVPRRLKR